MFFFTFEKKIKTNMKTKIHLSTSYWVINKVKSSINSLVQKKKCICTTELRHGDWLLMIRIEEIPKAPHFRVSMKHKFIHQCVIHALKTVAELLSFCIHVLGLKI